MYEQRGYYGRAITMLAHRKVNVHLCMAVYLYPIKVNLRNDFSRKARVMQSLHFPLEYFSVMQQNKKLWVQLGAPIILLAKLRALLQLLFGTWLAVHHNLPFCSLFSAEMFEIFLCNQWLMLVEKEVKTLYR